MGLALLSEVSLGCSSYEHWHRVARGFYVDGLGAIEAPSGADGGGDIRINVGASQLHLVKETSERIQTLDGYVELWTREPLQELGARELLGASGVLGALSVHGALGVLGALLPGVLRTCN